MDLIAIWSSIFNAVKKVLVFYFQRKQKVLKTNIVSITKQARGNGNWIFERSKKGSRRIYKSLQFIQNEMTRKNLWRLM